MLTKDVKLATWPMNNAKATMLVIVLSLAKTWRLSIPKDVTAPQLMPCHASYCPSPPLGTLVDNYQRYIRETTRIFYVSLPVDGLLRRRHCLLYTMV